MKNRKIHLTDLPSAAIIIVVIILYFTVFAGGFFSAYNFASVLTQSVIPCLLVLGVAMIIMSGGLDLSCGSVLSFSGCVTGLCMSRGLPLAISILAGILAGGLCGFANGCMISKMKIPPFIATMAMMNIASGLANTISGKKPIYWERNAVLDMIGTGSFLGIPIFGLIGVAVMILVILFFYQTKLRSSVYALGGNEEVLHLAGISIAKWKIIVYTISGILAGICGVLMDARITCGDPTAGTGLEFTAVVGAVIGGNIQNTGKGSLYGALLGALTLSIIRNGLSIMKLNTYWQMVLTGAILIVGMVIHELFAKIEEKQKLKQAEVRS